MEGTPQKPKICRFYRARSFSGSHFQGPCGFAGFPASRTAEMEGTPQKPKICRFCRVRSFSGSHFPGPCGFSWVSGFWDRRNGGNPNKSPKFVDFVEPAPFPEATSKAPVDFPGFPGCGTADMEGTPQKPKICRFYRARSFSGSHFQGPCGFAAFPASGTAEMEGTPQKPKICRFCRVRSFSGSHFQGLLVDFLDFWPPKAGVPRFRPGEQHEPRIRPGGAPRFRPGASSRNPELVREEPPKARNLVTVSRIVPIQKDK